MLKVEGLNASYGESRVLWNVNLEVKPGEGVALLGRNGVGKTTMLRVLAGLHGVQDGKLLFDGSDITRHAPHKRARGGLAYVPQGRGILPHLTVEENLLMGLNATQEKGIPDFIYDLFPVLKEMLHRKGGNLSGGQQQQLAIGRALTMRPKMLLLDEPTEGIQPNVVQQIGEALKVVRNELKVSVLLVEQYLDFAWNFAERYYVLQRGVITHTGETHTDDVDTVSRFITV
ncbi:urea ABC transporter ATP-binding subunit UrtE [Deinococcus cellulosilyticus]|uniref:ABC transporter ATP-binding protein n=1 Tax=Deinococcus cellulosilyticus (strain DSM 18568 / NBRC 106333 / KACC 11606 / 5516J-15) TaxID=1223518 RepID=A0A511MXZ7_DEIC1|nr:urea ABC transporter ATP-binding subunit UrtE [Deinococcus cellulosilyticus]GEM45006.1 ABC transporter ATP-binding protein [Deinococcus cellulosilyticus NBRC 106333 = KACC 11606]